MLDVCLGETMTDTNWLGYAGAVIGVIGAIRGIAGAMLAFIAYRCSNQLKALDLRLEPRKNAPSLVAEANELADK